MSAEEVGLWVVVAIILVVVGIALWRTFSGTSSGGTGGRRGGGGPDGRPGGMR